MWTCTLWSPIKAGREKREWRLEWKRKLERLRKSGRERDDGRKVKAEAVTKRIKKKTVRRRRENERILGNDPKVRQGIKYWWVPMANLAFLKHEKASSGTFSGSVNYVSLSLCSLYHSLWGFFHLCLSPICRPDTSPTNWGLFCRAIPG